MDAPPMERRILLGPQRLDGVVFLPAPSTPRDGHRLFPTGRSDVHHVSTDDISRVAHIRRALLDRIAGARKKVLFCSFLFADEEIVRALCDAAERLHGGVYVLTALGKHLQAEILELDAELDAGAARNQDRARRHEDHLRRLALAGVWLRSTEDCHAKFCVVDDEVAVVTSANATQEAYESNPEDGVVLDNPAVARDLGRLFSHVWLHLSSLESTPGSLLDVRSLPSRRAPDWHPLERREGISAVATLRREDQGLVKAAVDVIDHARSRLEIATYSFIGMEKHVIGAALERAIRRGVSLELLLQPRNHIAGQRASCAWVAGLAPDQVHLHGHRRTHTKSIVADRAVALVWTGNLEAAHGWDNGIEVGLFIHDAGVASAVASWTENVCRRRTHVALVSPSATELVALGQLQALAGDWTLQLPSGASLGRIADALEHVPVEVVEQSGKVLLRLGKDLLMDVRIDEAKRHIDVTHIRRPETLPGCRSRGWVAGSTLRVVASHTPYAPPTRPGPPRSRRNNGGR